MDQIWVHPTTIHVLAVFASHDTTLAADLVAIAGEHSIQILSVSPSTIKPVANFHVGMRTTALAWSPATVSPDVSDEWNIELTAATVDYKLHLLTKTHTTEENVFTFGGGLSGHHGIVNDMTFCGGRDESSTRYLATVSDDKMLMVWDLYPSLPVVDTGSPSLTPPPDRAQPVAFVVPFSHPLTCVTSHPSTTKELVVADCRGTIFLTDWRSEPDDADREPWRSSSIIELTAPSTLGDAALGVAGSWTMSVAWRRDMAEMIAATYGNKCSFWDISQAQGGTPSVTITSFSKGQQRIRWCDTHPDFFAIASDSPAEGATIHLHSSNYLSAHPTAFTIAPKPHFVKDFDFLSTTGTPRMAAAVGRKLFVFSIGDE